MSTEQQMYHVYYPSGFVGTMTLETARQYAKRTPHVLIEPVDRPRSKQADDVCWAAEQRKQARESSDQEHSAGVPWWMFMAFLAVYTYFIMAAARASW